MGVYTINYAMQLRSLSGWEKKKRQVFARPVIKGKSGNADIAEALVRSTTLTRADIEAVLTGLGEQLVDCLRRGELVTLDGIGSFSVRIKSEQTTDSKGKVKLDDLHVSGVLFKPSRDFLNKVQEVSFKPTAGPVVTMPSDEEVALKMDAHFESSDYITSSDVIRMFRVSQRRCRMLLQRLVDEGRLLRRGHGPTTHYIRPA